MAPKDDDQVPRKEDDDDVQYERLNRFNESAASFNLRIREMEAVAEKYAAREPEAERDAAKAFYMRQEFDELAARISKLDHVEEAIVFESPEKVFGFADPDKREILLKADAIRVEAKKVRKQVIYLQGSFTRQTKKEVHLPPPEPPTGPMVGIAQFLLPQKLYKRYVEPQIADIQWEFLETMKEGKKGLAYFRLVRGYLYWLIPVACAFWKKLGPLWNWASK